MIRMIDELVVRGEPGPMAEFKARIDSASNGTWARERSFEVGSDHRPSSKPRLVFGSEQIPGLRPALLVLGDRGPKEIKVSILSNDPDLIGDEDYNRLLASFGEFLASTSAGLDIAIELIPFRVKMDQIVSFEAMCRLKGFVEEAADKAQLTRFDRARWRRFVTQVHRDGSALYPEELDHWLKAAGWDEEVRRHLVDDYELGLTLLKEYDEERVG